MESLLTAWLVGSALAIVALVARHELLGTRLHRQRRRADEAEADLADARSDLSATRAELSIVRGERDGLEDEVDRLEGRIDALENRIDIVGALADASIDELHSDGRGSPSPVLAEGLSHLNLHDESAPGPTIPDSREHLYVIFPDHDRGGIPSMGRVEAVSYEISPERARSRRFAPRGEVGGGRALDMVEAKVETVMQRHPRCGWEVRDDPLDHRVEVHIEETVWVYAGPVIIGGMSLHRAAGDVEDALRELSMGLARTGRA